MPIAVTQRFAAAPWSLSIKAASTLAVAVLAAIWLSVTRYRIPGAAAGALIAVLPPAIVAGALLFIVTGYELDGRTLVVRRLFWSTRVALDGLDRAWHDPGAMARSIRIFGNGGLFAITGLFRSSRLGNYRAFVTNPANAVVLRAGGRAFVVSPALPHAFLARVKASFPAVEIGSPAALA
ncbi:MAG TPA: PH domain-containing protein [Usitatibacter sp.]|nr:PH domain-containing protein [Usitatibacter sp.]